MKKNLSLFASKLLISLLLVFGLHVLVLKLIHFEPNYELMITAYIVNCLLVLFIVGIISFYINKLKTYIGFLFMFGSLLKFAVFFIWFYPILQLGGNANGIAFSLFFVPYIVGLFLETLELTKISKDI